VQPRGRENPAENRGHTDDAYLTSLIEDVTDWMEQYTGGTWSRAPRRH
jgi:hypothetical protein